MLRDIPQPYRDFFPDSIAGEKMRDLGNEVEGSHRSCESRGHPITGIQLQKVQIGHPRDRATIR